MSVIVKVNFEAIINKYNQMIWCALPNLLNPLSERCTENPEIKKETISFEYKNMNWYQISGVNIYGFVDYEFNTTLNHLNNLLPENEQKAISIFDLNNNLIYKDVNIPYKKIEIKNVE